MNDNTTDTAAGDAPADDWAAAMMEQGAAEAGATPAAAKKPQDDAAYKRAKFQDLDTGAAAGASGEYNLDVILDIPVTLSMEIGRTEIPIQNLLQLNQGSVVELDRLAGEPMDVLINGTLIAHGEVVVVNEKFGIRLTDVISPSERVRKLR
jgi:flagellar motor switch protein FliN/FliY